MADNPKRPPGCEHCTKECTIHLTQIVGDKIIKMDLCPDCPKGKQLQDPEKFGLLEKLIGKGFGLPAQVPGSKGLVCPGCGFSQEDLKQSNRLGCPQCYETFRKQVEQLLPNLHKGTEHVGKVPPRFEKAEMGQQLENLREQLQKEIQEENYERAAELRDRIRELEKSLGVR